jgi:hypothetical protein
MYTVALRSQCTRVLTFENVRPALRPPGGQRFHFSTVLLSHSGFNEQISALVHLLCKEIVKKTNERVSVL